MNDRELFQLAGHLNPVTYPDLYYYYEDQPKLRIKRLIQMMESKNYIVFTCYEKTGFYVTPEGMEWYQQERLKQ